MKTITQAVTNYKGSVGLVPERYRMGVESADWAGAVRRPEAEQNWAAGVQQAAAEQRYGKGVARVSNEEWRRMAATKGAASIAQGMQLGADKYQRRFAPILSAMVDAAKGLPARSTDPMANIDTRLKPIVTAAITAARANSA